jgi:hypothetical protein
MKLVAAALIAGIFFPPNPIPIPIRIIFVLLLKEWRRFLRVNSWISHAG